MKYDINSRKFGQKLTAICLEQGLVDKKGKPDKIALYNLLFPNTPITDAEHKQDSKRVNDQTRMIDDWLRGKRYPKKIDIVLDLCNALNCDLDYFFTDMPEPTHDLKFIADSTELSYQAVQALQNSSEHEQLILDTMLKKGYFRDICFAIYSYMQTYHKELVIQDKDTGDTKLQDTEKMEIAEYRATKHFSNLLVNKLANDEDIRNYNDYEHDLEALSYIRARRQVEVQHTIEAIKESPKKIEVAIQDFINASKQRQKINNSKGDD